MARRFDTQPKAPALPGSDPACKDCRFWVSHEADLGSCRRYPPSGGIKQPTAYGPLILPVITPADHYCGEHQPRSGRA